MAFVLACTGKWKKRNKNLPRNLPVLELTLRVLKCILMSRSFKFEEVAVVQNSSVKSFRHIGLMVRNLEESLVFYQEFIGLTIAKRDIESGSFISRLVGIDNVVVEWVKLNIPGGGLVELLQNHSHPDPEAVREASPCPFNRLGCSHLAFTVTNLQTLYEKLVSSGRRCLSPPLDSPDGKVRVLFTYDPDGILLELVEEKGRAVE